MKIFEKSVEFNYINDRNYVHSSSIIQCIWLNIESYFHSYDGQGIFMDIRFHHILNSNAKLIVFDEHQNFLEKDHISSEGVVYTEGMKLYFYLFEDTNSKVVKSNNFKYCVDVNCAGDYEGVCIIGTDDIDSYISNIIEANKRVHKITLCEKSKIEVVNLYMKKIPILCLDEGLKLTTITIKNLGVREHGDGVATLNKIKFHDFSGLQFDVAFFVKEGV